MTEAGWFGAGKALVWPIALLIHYGTSVIFADERKELEARERKLSVEQARKVIAQHEREEQAKWTKTFRDLNR